MNISKKNPLSLMIMGGAAFAFVLIFLFSPLGIVLIQSLWSAPLGRGGSLTFQWYPTVLTDTFLHMVVANTLIIAVGTVVLSMMIGVGMAFIVNRTDIPLGSKLENILIMPIFIPTLTLAMSYSLFLSPVGYFVTVLKFVWPTFEFSIYEHPYTFIILLISTQLSVYVFLLASSTLKLMDASLEESARVAGSGVLRTALKVSLPLIRPSLIFGLTLVFIQSVEQFAIPMLIGQPKQIYVLTTYIYWLENRTAFTPEGDAFRNGTLGAFAICVVCSLLVLAFAQRRFLGKTERFRTVSGKATRFRPVRIGRFRYVAFAFCVFYILLTTVVPIVVIFYTSLVKQWSPTVNQLHLFTFGNWLNLFSDPYVIKATTNTLIIAFVGATLGISVAAAASYVIYRSELFGRHMLDIVTWVPSMVPGIIMGLAFLWFWLRFPLPVYGTVVSLIITYVIRHMSFAVRNTSSALLTLNPELEESSRVCGASFIKTFTKITTPLIRTGLLGAWILLFVTFFSEFTTALLLYSPASVVMSTLMYDWWEVGSFPMIATVAFLQFSIIGACLLVMNRMGIRLARF